ncbi:hypothetical protein B0H63DRAFT_508746 [Podospora didyma]|uniref:Zn(2)-C6 fungal-type domain-containing protein n=1 Tax=Podospora didyma TaxID=330526 RepID=A0AAE0NSE2_9PEZI|nr:hypothetical protein B0H63DRAFT_508746 [Podospora didyma]
MVYCGRPSMACLPCRQKRRRCDQLEPGCSQCARASVSCPGYRDTWIASLRDQTEAVAERVQRAKARKCRSPSPADSGSSSLQTNIVKHVPSAPVEQVALSYFFERYAPTSPFSYLAKLPAATRDFPDSVLLAPALALLAQDTRHPRYLEQARQNYVAAIAETNAALADASLADRDVTLASILLLALFEATIFHGRTSPTSWAAHTQGAVALIRLRGARQLERPLGRALFLHASANISTWCLQRGERVPHAVAQLNQRFFQDSYPDRPASDPPLRLLPILHDMSELLAGPGRDRQSRSEYYYMGLRMLDARLVSIMENMWQVWPFKETKGQTWHRYPSYRAAKFWTITRMLRMLLQQASVGVGSADSAGSAGAVGAPSAVPRPMDEPCSDNHEAPLGENIVQNIDSLSRDILESVSYFLNSSIHRSVALSTRCLIWPLAVIAICPFARGSVCNQARRQLEFLACKLGMAQAREALDMVKEGQLMEGWLHICLLS